MAIGDLVRGHFSRGRDKWTRQGLFVGFKNSNGYVYAEVYWFHENKVGSCQPRLLEVIHESN